MSLHLRRRTRRRSTNAPVSVFDPAYDDVRLFKVIGVQQNDTWSGTAADMQAEYDKYMKPAYHGDGSVFFGVRYVVRWNNSIKDDPANGGTGTVIPTLAQMRDPAWPGYTWNDASGNPTGTHQLDTMRNAQSVVDGKAKVLMQLAISATSGDPVPAFMMSGAVTGANGVVHSDYAWTGSNGQERVKFWNSTARQYAANFALAAIDRFVGTASGGGNVGSVKFGEYFPGNQRPDDFPSVAAYDDGYWQMLGLISDGMSPAADGKRVWIHQSNPQQTATHTYNDLKSRKMGMSASDPHFWGVTGGGSHSASFFERDNYHGIIPMAAPGDSPNYVQITRGETTWQVPPDNPFGFINGEVVDIEPIHGAWWYGHHGIVRMDQEFVVAVGATNRTLTGQSQNTFMMAMDAFGPGGTWHGTGTGKWGGVPFME